MPLNDDQELVRVEILGKLNKWIRGIKDNIIAEEGAIKQYTEHVSEFGSDFKLDVSEEALVFRALTFMGMDYESANLIATKIWQMVYGSEEHKSLLKIKEDEEEHRIELNGMIETIQEIIKKIKKLGK